MPRPLSQEVVKTAGNNFAGTEFSIPGRRQSLRKLLEVNLVMGNESNSWEIRKTSTKSGALPLVLRQSESAPGVFGPNTQKGVLLSGRDAETMLEPGEEIQVFTSGGTTAMRAKVLLLDLDPADLV